VDKPRQMLLKLRTNFLNIVVSEEWGGKNVFVEVSKKDEEGLIFLR
jgi:hypothetical protein